MQSAAEIVEAEVPQLPLSFVDIAVYDNGPDALAIQLAKCRRAQEWTAEHIAEVFLTFVRYLRAGWFSLDDAESAMLDLRDLVNGFAVTLEEALSVVLRPEFRGEPRCTRVLHHGIVRILLSDANRRV